LEYRSLCIIHGCSVKSAHTARLFGRPAVYTARTLRNARAAAITRRVGIDRQKVRKGRWLELVGQRRLRRSSLRYSRFIFCAQRYVIKRIRPTGHFAHYKMPSIYFLFYFLLLFLFPFLRPNEPHLVPSLSSVLYFARNDHNDDNDDIILFLTNFAI